MSDERSRRSEPAIRASRPTIVDVAREAGVGIGTASRALTGHPRVADATRARVQAVAERLGYQASVVARAFTKRRTQTLELIIPFIGRYLFLEILRGVEEALADTDYSLVIRSVERASERERVFDACCTPGRADGVLIVSMQPPDRLVERLLSTRFPAVLIDTVCPELPSVTVDYPTGEQHAVEHCVRLGHQRIALIDRPADPFGPLEPSPRLLGYHQGMAAAGLPVPDQYVQVAPFDPVASAVALTRLWSLPRSPTAVLVGSDTQAMGVLDAARHQGISVPEDLSIVGFNDVELAPYLGLTTVHVPMREVGRQGALSLLSLIDGHDVPSVEHVLPVELVIRQTCGPAPATRKPGSSQVPVDSSPGNRG